MRSGQRKIFLADQVIPVDRLAVHVWVHEMNPLYWKREHQIALLCAIALGCFFGTIVGVWAESGASYTVHWMLYCTGAADYRAGRWYNCTSMTPVYWLQIGLWAALGGFICATLVYIRQLLRA